MKLKQQASLSALHRHLFGVLDDHFVAWSRLRMKSSGTSRRFSPSLARPRWSAKLHHNRAHHPAHLSRGDRTRPWFPRTKACLPQLASQHDLVECQRHQQAPALELFRSAHMDLCPEQVLFQEAIAMLVREPSLVAWDDVMQGKERQSSREHHIPALARIAFAVCGSRPLDPQHAHLDVTCLTK